MKHRAARWGGVLAVLAVAGLATVVILVASDILGQDLTVRGSIDVPVTSSSDDPPCRVKSDYAGIGVGTQVVVRNAEGTIIGQGRLDAKRPISPAGPAGPEVCRFTFAVGLEQASTEYYSIKVGRTGEAVYTDDRLRTGGPIVLTLGRSS